MGRTAGTLGLAPAAAEEGPAAVEGLADVEGPAAAMSAVEEPVAAREGPTVGGEGPWRTRDLKK